MEFQVARWEIERDKVEISYTARQAMPEVQISKWATRWDQLIS
jgi:hypothetical protein